MSLDCSWVTCWPVNTINKPLSLCWLVGNQPLVTTRFHICLMFSSYWWACSELFSISDGCVWQTDHLGNNCCIRFLYSLMWWLKNKLSSNLCLYTSHVLHRVLLLTTAVQVDLLYILLSPNRSKLLVGSTESQLDDKEECEHNNPYWKLRTQEPSVSCLLYVISSFLLPSKGQSSRRNL